MSMRSFSSCGESAGSTRAGLAGKAHLVTGEHVDAPPKAVVQPFVLFIAVTGGGYGQTVRTNQWAGRQAVELQCWCSEGGAPAQSERSHGGGAQGCTHPFDAIVTIGAARPDERASGAGRGGGLISCVFSRS